ncbi:MAG TPA: DUF1028 domain-containing protein, partial [Rubrobacteraceae bacterium]
MNPRAKSGSTTVPCSRLWSAWEKRSPPPDASGQAAGGDKRGKQSAAITTMKDQPYPYVDLRVDEHPDPIAELRRIYEVFKVQMLPFVEALPTGKNPEG